MAARWTLEDDLTLHAFYPAVGDFVGVHDLGRPKGAAAARYKKLKACGALDALDRRFAAERDYRRALGLRCAEDEVE